MKLRKCLMCGSWFEAYQAHQHVCDSCDDYCNDERGDTVSRELTDPAVKARIEAGVRKEMEP